MGLAWILWAMVVGAVFITLLLLSSKRENVMNPEEDQPSSESDNENLRRD